MAAWVRVLVSALRESFGIALIGVLASNGGLWY
jgi:hypothetical protein